MPALQVAQRQQADIGQHERQQGEEGAPTGQDRGKHQKPRIRQQATVAQPQIDPHDQADQAGQSPQHQGRGLIRTPPLQQAVRAEQQTTRQTEQGQGQPIGKIEIGEADQAHRHQQNLQQLPQAMTLQGPQWVACRRG